MKADAWSVGLLIYYVLTGRNAVTKPILNKYEEMKTVEPSIIFKKQENVPEHAQDLVKSLLTVNRVKRMSV